MDDKKYIIFDLDGTLVDSYTTVVNACRRVFAEHAPAAVPTDDFFDDYRGKDLEPMFATLAEKTGMSPCEFRESYDRQYAADCHSGTTIIQRQYDIMQDARQQGLGIIVLTNKRQELAEAVCNALFNRGEIDYVIGRKDATPIKPRHVLIERLQALGIDAATQCLKYFGDSETDRKTAELLNTHFININI